MMEQNSANDPVPATWGYENPNAQVSVKEFEELIALAYQDKKDIKQFEDAAESLKEKLKEKQVKIEAIMDQLGKEVYKSDSGTVTLKTSLSVATPKEQEAKQAFFAWLEEQGLFFEYASVDSRKLNTLFNSLAQGNPDFKVPGIEKPKPFKTLKLLK